MIAATGGAIAVGGSVLYGSYRALRYGVTFSRRAWGFGTRTVKLYELIEKELQPNGGTSLRDAVNRIEIRQLLAEQRHRAVLSANSQAYFECDAQGACIWANREYLRLTGRTLEEIRGNGWVNAISADEQDEVFEGWRHAVEQSRDYTGRFVIVTPDGERQPVVAQSVVMFDNHGRVIGFVGTVTRVDE